MTSKSTTLENVPLINDKLRGVYPFDPTLDEKTEKAIAREARDNPAYGTIIYSMAESLQKKVLDDYFSKKR